jgi:hypothetical protein
MVKYYGRARQRIGSVNTNQIGLKMSGCPSKVGRQGYLSRYIGRRAQCNQKYCGPVYYHGVLWKWNSGRCVAKAPRGQSFNSGVGHKSTPRFACGNTCATELTLDAAFDIIFKYFSALADPNGYIPALVGTKETLKSDLGDVHDTLLNPIQHLEPGNTYYDNAPPAVKKAILSVNNKNLAFKIKGNLRKHIVGLVTVHDKSVLYDNGFGIRLKLSPTSVVVAFGDGGDACINLKWAIEADPSDPHCGDTLCNMYTQTKNYLSFRTDLQMTIYPTVPSTNKYFFKTARTGIKNNWNPGCTDLTSVGSLPNGPFNCTDYNGFETIYNNVVPINDTCGVGDVDKRPGNTDIVMTISLKGDLLTSNQISDIENILGKDFNGEQIKLAGPNTSEIPSFIYGDESDAAYTQRIYYCPLASGKCCGVSTTDDHHGGVVTNVISRKNKAHNFLGCLPSQ